MNLKSLLLSAAILFVCQGPALGLANHRPRITVKVNADSGVLDSLLLDKQDQALFLNITRIDLQHHLAYYFPCMDWTSGFSDTHTQITATIYRRPTAYFSRIAFTLEYAIDLHRRTSLLKPQPAHTTFRETGIARQTPIETQDSPDELRPPPLPPEASAALVQLQREVHTTLSSQFVEQLFRETMNKQLIGLVPISNALRVSEGGKGGVVTILVDGRKMRLRPGSAPLHIRVDKTSAPLLCANPPDTCVIEVQGHGVSSNDELLGVFTGIPCCSQRWPPDLGSTLAGGRLGVYLDPSHLHCDLPEDPCMPLPGAEN